MICFEITRDRDSSLMISLVDVHNMICVVNSEYGVACVPMQVMHGDPSNPPQLHENQQTHCHYIRIKSHGLDITRHIF